MTKLLMEKKSETSMRSVSFEGEKGIDAGGLLRDWCLDLPIKIGGELGFNRRGQKVKVLISRFVLIWAKQ